MLIGIATGKESACQCRRCKSHGFDPWIEKIPGVGNGDLLQCSCLENSMERGAWRATVHGVTKSWTRLSNWAHSFFLFLFLFWWAGNGIISLTSLSDHSLLVFRNVTGSYILILYPQLYQFHWRAVLVFCWCL